MIKQKQKNAKNTKHHQKNNKTPSRPAAPMATSYIPFYHSYISYNPTRLQFYTPFFLHRPPFYPRKANSTRRPNCRRFFCGSPRSSRVSILKASKIPELNGSSNGKIIGQIKGTSWTHIGNYRKIIDNSIIIHFLCRDEVRWEHHRTKWWIYRAILGWEFTSFCLGGLAIMSEQFCAG